MSERRYMLGMSVTRWMLLVHSHAVSKGWWDEFASEPGKLLDGSPNSLHRIASDLCLIHSEVSEALEALRDRDMGSISLGGKPEGVASELADVVIRAFDLAQALGIDLESEMVMKAEYNETRKYRHGGRAL